MGWLFGESKAEKARKERILKAWRFKPNPTFASSGFATDEDLYYAGCFGEGGTIVGKSLESDEFIKFYGRVRPHMAVFGGTGLGKSSWIESILLDFPGSIICFDVKSEHAVMSGDYRRRFGPVYQWNPARRFENQLRNLRPVRINPMGPHWLDAGRWDLEMRIQEHAASIITTVDGSNKYFHDTPRGLWAALEMAQTLHGVPEHRNMPYIAQHILGGDVKDYCAFMASRTPSASLRAGLSRFANGTIKSLDECIETGRTETEFLRNETIAPWFGASDINFGSFRNTPQTLYINAPLEAQKTFAPTNRLLFGTMLNELFQGEGGGEVPVLIIADEIAAYSQGLDAYPAACATGRAYNVGIISCFTSQSQLVKMTNKHEDVMNNQGMSLFLDAYSIHDSELVSKWLGEKEIAVASKTSNYPVMFDSLEPFEGNDDDLTLNCDPGEKEEEKVKVTTSYSVQRVPLMRPHEIRQMSMEHTIGFMRECRKPIFMKRAPYFETYLRERANRNPFFKG